MYKYYIDLNKFENVKKFCQVASQKQCAITLKRGKYVVDGKSIIGIFSLDLSFPVELEVEDGDYSAFDKFRINSEI